MLFNGMVIFAVEIVSVLPVLVKFHAFFSFRAEICTFMELFVGVMSLFGRRAIISEFYYPYLLFRKF